MFILRMNNKNIAFYSDVDLISIGFDNKNYSFTYLINEIKPKLLAMENNKKIHYRAFLCSDNSPSYFLNEIFNVEIKHHNNERFYARRYDRCHYKTANLIVNLYNKYFFEQLYYDGSDTEIDD